MHTMFDSKYFYLNLVLLENEWIRIKLSTTPENFIENHDSHYLVDVHENFYTEVRGVMHWLPQVGHLAYEDLESYLAQCGCKPEKFIPGLWKHMNNGISFTLVVDDFWIKFYTMKSLKHFINSLQQKYEIPTSMEGHLLVVFTLDWNITKKK